MAGSKSIGGVFATLSIKDVNFDKKLKSAGNNMSKFGKAASAIGGPVAIAIAAAGAAMAGLAVGTKKTLSMGGELADLSAQTGVAISDLMRIQQAYKDNGKEASSAGKDINKMQKAIVAASDDPANDPFAAIGLSVKNLMAMNPSEQFFAIGDAIKQIQDPAKQVAASMKIFGKSGGELLPVFKGSSLEDINRSLGRSVEVMNKFAGKFDEVDDKIGRLSNKSNQFFVGFASGVVDQMLPALDRVDGYDFTNLGQSIGEFFGAAMSFLTDDTAWKLFVLNAELALAKILQLPGFKQVAMLGERLANGGNLNPVASISDGGNVTLIQEEIDQHYASIAEKTAAANVKIDEDRNQEISKQMDAIATTVAPAMQVNVPEAQGRLHLILFLPSMRIERAEK